MSAIFDFYDMYKFETYTNGFLDLEYPNFDPKYVTRFGIMSRKSPKVELRYGPRKSE